MLRKHIFNLWYYFNPPWETGISPPELIAYIESHSPGRALDLGCGTGTNAITLTKHNWETVGVDFSSRAIKIAKRKARREGVIVEFFVDDVTNLEKISGKFDLILDMGCFHGLSHESRLRYLNNLERLLPAHGTFLLYAFIQEDPNVENSGVREQEIQRMSERFVLVDRKDGNERGIRPSTWLTFRKKSKQ